MCLQHWSMLVWPVTGVVTGPLLGHVSALLLLLLVVVLLVLVCWPSQGCSAGFGQDVAGLLQHHAHAPLHR
jgi:uncharacterized membrane protein YhaH (DUF805 family)